MRAVAAGHGCALDGSVIPTVLEGVSTNSMATNPVPLQAHDLTAILEASL